MTQKDLDQITAVMRHIVEDGDTWALLPKHIQDAAMAQFLRTQNNTTLAQ